jgi:thioredoxin-dependent peroxiredoxin
MATTNEKITFQGNPVEILGSSIKVGQKAPDFRLIGNDMQPATLSSYAGKKIVLSVVPSIDTPVCQVQTRAFNQKLAAKADTVVLTVSRDLPFAQKRWCGAEGIENVVTLSDYNFRTFGEAYGVLMGANQLLARAVFVIDTAGMVAYVEYVNDIVQEPDYDAVMAAL